MTLKNTLKTALTGLAANKTRSALTILGIVIGITAIILIVSIGKAAQKLILNEVQGLGSKTIFVTPGRQPKGPSDFAQTLGDSLKEKDLEMLKKKTNVPTANEIMPFVFTTASAAYQNETYRITVYGATEAVSQLFDVYPAQGMIFTKEDVISLANVVVIGSKVKEELFGDSNVLGQKIKIKNHIFRVIGVMPTKGKFSFMSFDDGALIPYTTALQYLLGTRYFHHFIIQAQSDETMNQTVLDIETTLRNSHGITDPEKDDFHVETPADIAQRLDIITNTLTLFLALVAAVSLVVGGIGIMNIMLVSVTERTREIGLRKALGATDSDILNQFLFEAILLTMFGGFLGIGCGAGLAYLASLILSRVASINWTFVFPVQAALLGLGVAAFVGLVFGLYPARRAAVKNPVEALRYE
jgi:putative ABC transport system permease protein